MSTRKNNCWTGIQYILDMFTNLFMSLSVFFLFIHFDYLWLISNAESFCCCSHWHTSRFIRNMNRTKTEWKKRVLARWERLSDWILFMYYTYILFTVSFCSHICAKCHVIPFIPSLFLGILVIYCWWFLSFNWRMNGKPKNIYDKIHTLRVHCLSSNWIEPLSPHKRRERYFSFYSERKKERIVRHLHKIVFPFGGLHDLSSRCVCMFYVGIFHISSLFKIIQIVFA